MEYKGPNNKITGAPALGPKRRNPVPATPLRFEGSVKELVRALRPDKPLYIIKPEVLTHTARNFISAFPGEVMFAVKANPEKAVLQTLSRAGLRAFDCASIEEVR